MQISLDDIQRVLNPGSGSQTNVRVTGYSVDTRTLAMGDLFIALRGPNHDGHDHVASAFESGAAAIIVGHELPVTGPQIGVPDTFLALQQLAVWARGRWAGDVVGVTGSAGKTTTK